MMAWGGPWDKIGTSRSCWICKGPTNHYTITFWGAYLHYCDRHAPPFPACQNPLWSPETVYYEYINADLLAMEGM